MVGFFPGTGKGSHRGTFQVSASFAVIVLLPWSLTDPLSVQSILTKPSSALPPGEKRSSLRGRLRLTAYIISAHSLHGSSNSINCRFLSLSLYWSRTTYAQFNRTIIFPFLAFRYFS